MDPYYKIVSVDGTGDNNIWLTAVHKDGASLVLRYDGKTWTEIRNGEFPLSSSRLVRVFTPRDIILAGPGLIFSNGVFWTFLNYSYGKKITAMSAKVPGDMFFSGPDLGIAHYNGAEWKRYEKAEAQMDGTVTAIYTSGNKVFAVGSNLGTSKGPVMVGLR